MKFQTDRNNQGQYRISVTLGDYDAQPPATEFTADHAPKIVSPDRFAVAVTLLFSSWCGGEMIFPQPIGPNTVSEIRKFLHPVSAHCSPIGFYPKPIPEGSRTTVAYRAKQNLAAFPTRQPYLLDLPTDKYNGSVRTHSSLQVATNAFLFADNAQNEVESLLGVAVLFAEDFDIDRFALSESPSEREARRISSLLSSVRLGLAD